MSCSLHLNKILWTDKPINIPILETYKLNNRGAPYGKEAQYTLHKKVKDIKYP